jgi:hypothetical protein
MFEGVMTPSNTSNSGYLPTNLSSYTLCYYSWMAGEVTLKDSFITNFLKNERKSIPFQITLRGKNI